MIVAAERQELAGLLRRASGLQPLELGLRWCRRATLGARPVVLAANGAGRLNAAQVVKNACEELPIRGVVSTGWCGGLDSALWTGQVVVADRVVSLEPPAEFAAQWPGCSRKVARGVVLTVDAMVQTAEQKRALGSMGAVAVEMEAAGVAAQAQKRDLPFFCVRAVSDAAATTFRIDYNRARRADGRFSAARVVAQAGLVPERWKELLGLWRAAKSAAEALGEFFESCRFEV